MIWRNVNEWVDNFDRAQTLTTTPGMNGWKLTQTAAGGSPTFAIGSLGLGMVATLASTSEVENICASHNDILSFPTIGLQRVEFIANVTAMLTGSSWFIGMGTARNDTITSVTSMVGFTMVGATSTSNVYINCHDGTTTNDNVSAATTLSTTDKLFGIDFTNGLADIRFEIDGARVAAGTTFSMAALTSTSFLQPIIQLQKTATTNVTALAVKRVRIQYADAYGA